MTRSTRVRSLIDRFRTEAELDRERELTPDVGVIMGSDSDLPVMRAAHDVLVDLGFEEATEASAGAEYSFETYVISAHRTPELMSTYARTADDRGLEVVIAGAGGKSADLPNMTASIAYPLPVIGVPIDEKSIDSVIGMPSGAPIVAVDAGKAGNAALSAAQILARGDAALRERLIERHTDLQDRVAEAADRLHEVGTPAYLDEA